MKAAVALAAVLWAAPSAAEVVSSNATGFHLRHSVAVRVPTDDAFSSFLKIERWWNPEHSYSGKADALSLQATPGGCFCEFLPGGGIEHLRVTYLDSGKRLVMTGGLGPLLYEATAGVLDIKFEPQPGGSRVTMEYKVAGFASGGADKLAPLVDKVLTDQWTRYAAATPAN